MQPNTVVRRSQIAQYVGPRVAESDNILSMANVSQMEKDRKSFKSWNNLIAPFWLQLKAKANVCPGIEPS